MLAGMIHPGLPAQQPPGSAPGVPERRPSDTRAGLGASAGREPALDRRPYLRFPLRIVSGAAEREPDDAGRRGEREVAAGEPEQVICSCRGHVGLHERVIASDKHPARRRDLQP